MVGTHTGGMVVAHSSVAAAWFRDALAERPWSWLEDAKDLSSGLLLPFWKRSLISYIYQRVRCVSGLLLDSPAHI